MKKRIKGVVKYINLGTGFWGIIGDNGQEYRPVNMPQQLKEEGKKVAVWVVEEEEGFSIFMWGVAVRVIGFGEGK